MAGLKDKFASAKRTICEVHREMYDILSMLPQSDETVKAIALLEEANKMAKKMSNKLFEYHYDVAEHAEQNKNYVNSLDFRLKSDAHEERY